MTNRDSAIDKPIQHVYLAFMANTKIPQTTINVDRAIYAQFGALARLQGKTISGLLGELMTEFVHKKRSVLNGLSASTKETQD